MSSTLTKILRISRHQMDLRACAMSAINNCRHIRSQIDPLTSNCFTKRG